MDTSQFSEKMEYKPIFDAHSLLHAYIVLGPETDNKRAFIRTLASAMLCTAPGSVPCGVCPACKKSTRGIHPDMIEISRPEDKREIPVDTIRKAVRAQTFVVPNEADCKVFIIHEADTMNTQAQNALLKTLEEPQRYCRFILSAENPASLLPTVRSRCAEVRVTSRRDAAADTWLGERFFEALDAGKLKTAEFLYELEKADREKMADFLSQISQLSVTKMKSGGDCARLLKILSAVQKAEEYQKYNVSAGHIVGMLLAELADI